MSARRALADRKKELTRDAIKSAAKTLFNEKGYINCTIEAIADLAGVSRGSIYNYFLNKDELLISFLDPTTDKLRESGEKFKQDMKEGIITTGREVIMTFWRRYNDMYAEDPLALRILYLAYVSNVMDMLGEEAGKRYVSMNVENVRYERGIINLAIELKLLPPWGSGKLINLIWATFLGTALWRESKTSQFMDDPATDSGEFAFKIMADGLMAENAPRFRNE